MSCKQSNNKAPKKQDTFENVVNEYILNHREKNGKEYRFYKIQPSLEKAIEVATLSKLPSGKRHWHQRRIPHEILERARIRLLAAKLDECKSFSQLIEKISWELEEIKGIGDLTVYDISHRIGLYLGLEPKLVYLHAGTRAGAKAIGIGRGKQTLFVKDLPEAFGVLKPSEIEDCLCIYETELKKIYGTR